MKRLFLVFALLFAFLIPGQAFAAAVVPSYTYYVSYLDQYRMDYQIIQADHYDAYFVSPTGQVYQTNYNTAPTGIMYLTCNGTYHLDFYDAAGNTIGATKDTTTSGLINPSCSSYAGDSGANDLNVQHTPSTGGGYDLTWNPITNATNYEIWKDGQKLGETGGTSYHIPDGGSLSVVAKDASGNILGRSDLNIPTSCDVCKQLSQMLQCPDWDTYMGDLTQAFKNALPPPPDWQDIANKIGAATVQQLQDYYGPVPTAPPQADIESKLDKTLPTVDTSTYADQVTPTVPPGYESPIPFDISTGPQIDVTDNSQPFQILDPLNNLTYNDPGVPVVPGDSANSSGGIVKPVIISPYPTVTPKPLPSALPNEPIPIPSSSIQPAPTPNPSATAGTGPIPVYKGGTPTPTPTPASTPTSTP